MPHKLPHNKTCSMNTDYYTTLLQQEIQRHETLADWAKGNRDKQLAHLERARDIQRELDKRLTEQAQPTQATA